MHCVSIPNQEGEQVICMGPFSLALESTAKSAASGILYSGAVEQLELHHLHLLTLSTQLQWCSGANLPLQWSFVSLSTHSAYKHVCAAIRAQAIPKYVNCHLIFLFVLLLHTQGCGSSQHTVCVSYLLVR